MWWYFASVDPDWVAIDGHPRQSPGKYRLYISTLVLLNLNTMDYGASDAGFFIILVYRYHESDVIIVIVRLAGALEPKKLVSSKSCESKCHLSFKFTAHK